MIGCPTIPRPTLPPKEAPIRKLNFSQREIERETSIASLLTISSSLSSLFRVLCIFPLRYLCAIGLPLIFSFRWNLPPSFGLQSQTTRLIERPLFLCILLHTQKKSNERVLPPSATPVFTYHTGFTNGIFTLHDALSQRTWPPMQI